MSRGIVRRGVECCENDEVAVGLAKLSVGIQRSADAPGAAVVRGGRA